MSDLDSLLAGLETDAGKRGREFERVCSWFLENDPVYRRELRRVWLWNNWPGRWGPDAGIDLVAQDHAGRLWAIQAKAYSSEYAITKADVDTFLAESGRSAFAFRLLIATTNRIGRTARRTIEGQEKRAAFLLLGDLQRAQVDWPRSPAELQPAKRAPHRPRPHQREAIDAVCRRFASSDRGQLIMACGTGKTLAALFISEELAARRTLVLVPSLSLLAQTLREWTVSASNEFDFLAVCSDETVVDADAPVGNTSELGVPVTTDPADIATFLRRRTRGVIFATYQSSPRIAQAFTLARTPHLDLVIADEAHRCAGRVSSDFATVLDGDAIRAARRLFMTATPRYFTGRIVREAKEADFEVASMDDKAKFGTVFHRLTFGEAIDRDLLTDYQVAIIGVDDSTYRDWAEQGRFVTTDGTQVTDARTLAGQIGLAKAMRAYDLRRTITFHSRVAAAKKFSRDFGPTIAWMPSQRRPVGKVWCDYASGQMTSGERDRRLTQLGNLENADRGVLSNARCLAEGVDVPTLDGVAFIDPRRSEVDIVQAVGRAIRKAEGKKTGTIVIPVFISDTDEAENTLNDSAFKPVWDVLNALRAHDEILGEQLDALRQQLGRRGSPRLTLPSKVRVDLPERVGVDFAAAFRARLVEQTTASWEFAYGVLEKYVEREGHTLVPVKHIEARFKLGSWVNRQRTLGLKLAPDRRARLERLPGWVWNALDPRWEEAYGLLCIFAEREGNARVPRSYVEGGFKLGHWVARQRSRRDGMDVRRRALLERLPGWTWDPFDTRWEHAYGSLCAYTEREGHARVPQDHVEGGFKLGPWVAGQRTRRDGMDVRRRALLERLPGWVWDRRDAQWEEGYQYLCAFAEREGHARVPQDHVEGGFRLGSWIRAQRGRGERMDPDHRVRLERLPGWAWDAVDAYWEQGYQCLCAFALREGNTRVPQDHVEAGFNLGHWVHRQRRLGLKMAADRRDRLERLPEWIWNPHDAAWDEAFAVCKAFAEREGHTLLPRHLDERGLDLGAWVGNQRTAYRTSVLDPARAARLEELPGWSWQARTTKFERGMTAMQRFVEREGHARVLPGHLEEGFTLGAWVTKQRSGYRRGRIPADRAAKLEAIPGWSWTPRETDWEAGFSALQRYVATAGNALVPQDGVEEGFKLGGWVATQRMRYRQGSLDAPRVDRLNSVPGWSWAPHDQAWEGAFAQLLSFVQREGHARVPISHYEHGFALGRWINKQRTAYNAGRLPTERARRLEAVQGWTFVARM